MTHEVLLPRDPVARREVVVCFVGASLVAGIGDPKALGWVGRVVARSQGEEMQVTAYNLGVRGQGTGDVAGRWRAETAVRWRAGADRRLVIQAGGADLHIGTSLARTKLNLANVLDDAMAAGIAPLVVGVTPVLDEPTNDHLAVLSEAQADVCGRRGIPYVDCFRALRGHEQWAPDLRDDGVHPGQVGYGLIAWLVLHHGWDAWLRG